MKAERLSDDKIRFLLGADDLNERQLNLEDLNYGSPKAKELFHEMIQEAANRFGIVFDGHPVMIEAVPMAQDCLMITMTEVSDIEHPEALICGGLADLKDEPRTNKKKENESVHSRNDANEELKKRLYFPDANDLKKGKEKKTNTENFIFSFGSLNVLCDAVRLVPVDLKLQNALYHSATSGEYYLHVKASIPSTAQTRYTMSILSEYADDLINIPYGDGLLTEHCRLVIKARALQKMQKALMEQNNES